MMEPILRFVCVAFIVAAIVAFFMWRTGSDRILQISSEPYAVIEVVPESLSMARLVDEEERDHWLITYDLRVVSKRLPCSEILITRRLDRIGESTTAAINIVPSRPLAQVSSKPALIAGQAMQLSRPLPPGSYVIMIEILCFQEDGEGILVASSPPARSAPVCFQIPEFGAEPPRPVKLLTQRCIKQPA